MIKINDVKYSYENSETEALRGVSISIADGEFVAMSGITAAVNPHLQ